MFTKVLLLIIVALDAAAVFLAPRSYSGIFPWLSVLEIALAALVLLISAAAAWLAMEAPKLERQAWLLLFFTALLGSGALGLSFYFNYVAVVPAVYPSPSDFTWLGSYLFAALSLIAVMRRVVVPGGTQAKRGQLGFIFMVVVYVALTLALWLPATTSLAANLADKAATYLTPLLDFLIFAPAVAILVKGEPAVTTWRRPWFWVALGGLLLVAGDVAFAVTSWRMSFNPLIDFFWLAAYSCWAWAATLQLGLKYKSPA